MTADTTKNTITFFQNLLAEKPNGIGPADCGQYSEYAEVASERYTESGAAGVRQVLPKFPDRLIKILSTTDGETDSQPVWMPTREDESAGQLVTDLLAWLKLALPETPESMLRAAASFTVSALVFRRVAVNLGFGAIFPNEYDLIVAPPALAHKSTLVRTVGRLLESVQAPVIPGLGTPEAFALELSLTPPVNIGVGDNKRRWERGRPFYRTRSYTNDEIGGLFSGWNKRDYLAGVREQLLQAYECDNVSTTPTKTGGVTVIEDVYLSIFGATTPATIVESMRRESGLWADGTFSRFDIIAETKLKHRGENATQANYDIPPGIVDRLKKLFSGRLPMPELTIIPAIADDKGKIISPTEYKVETPRIILAPIEPEALDLWQKYHRHYDNLNVDIYNADLTDEKISSYGRMAVKALKKALLFAVCDWIDNGGELVITLAHVERGIVWAERNRAGLEGLLGVLHGKAVEQQIETKLDAVELTAKKMTEHLKRGAVSKRDFWRTFNKNNDSAQKAFAQIEKTVKEFGHKPAGAQRATPHYRLKEEE